MIDAIVDPNVVPLPPHVTLKQARALSSALLKGDPQRGAVAKQIFKEMLASWAA